MNDLQDFGELRRLLKLKRHEQPPPGYFNRFSSEVIARIKAGEQGEPASFIERMFGENSWWQRTSIALQSKPAFAGAFGAAVCALLVSGIVYSENGAPVVQGFIPDSANPAGFVAANDTLIDQAYLGSSSTNPLAPPSGSLFDHFPMTQVQNVSFTMP
jgi:hypothetical protein